MLRSALSLSAIWVCLFAGTASGGQLITVLEGREQATPEVLKAMEQSANAALAPGIRLTWRSVSQAEHETEDGPLAVIRLRGQCRAGDFRPFAPVAVAPGEPLGQTYISDGQVLSFADVLCDNVRALVGQNLNEMPERQRDGLLGLALGRVVAHELYHILLKTTSHAHQGLFRPAESSRDLLAPSNPFSRPDLRKLAALDTAR